MEPEGRMKALGDLRAERAPSATARRAELDSSLKLHQGRLVRLVSAYRKAITKGAFSTRCLTTAGARSASSSGKRPFRRQYMSCAASPSLPASGRPDSQAKSSAPRVQRSSSSSIDHNRASLTPPLGACRLRTHHPSGHPNLAILHRFAVTEPGDERQPGRVEQRPSAPRSDSL